jgi:hypothetical protein
MNLFRLLVQEENDLQLLLKCSKEGSEGNNSGAETGLLLMKRHLAR